MPMTTKILTTTRMPVILAPAFLSFVFLPSTLRFLIFLPPPLSLLIFLPPPLFSLVFLPFVLPSWFFKLWPFFSSFLFFFLFLFVSFFLCPLCWIRWYLLPRSQYPHPPCYSPLPLSNTSFYSYFATIRRRLGGLTFYQPFKNNQEIITIRYRRNQLNKLQWQPMTALGEKKTMRLMLSVYGSIPEIKLNIE